MDKNKKRKIFIGIIIFIIIILIIVFSFIIAVLAGFGNALNLQGHDPNFDIIRTFIKIFLKIILTCSIIVLFISIIRKYKSYRKKIKEKNIVSQDKIVINKEQSIIDFKNETYKCPYCHNHNDLNNEICTNCNYKFDRKTIIRHFYLKKIIFIVLAIFLIIYTYVFIIVINNNYKLSIDNLIALSFFIILNGLILFFIVNKIIKCDKVINQLKLKYKNYTINK